MYILSRRAQIIAENRERISAAVAALVEKYRSEVSEVEQAYNNDCGWPEELVARRHAGAGLSQRRIELRCECGSAPCEAVIHVLEERYDKLHLGSNYLCIQGHEEQAIDSATRDDRDEESDYVIALPPAGWDDPVDDQTLAAALGARVADVEQVRADIRAALTRIGAVLTTAIAITGVFAALSNGLRGVHPKFLALLALVPFVSLIFATLYGAMTVQRRSDDSVYPSGTNPRRSREPPTDPYALQIDWGKPLPVIGLTYDSAYFDSHSYGRGPDRRAWLPYKAWMGFELRLRTTQLIELRKLKDTSRRWEVLVVGLLAAQIIYLFVIVIVAD